MPTCGANRARAVSVESSCAVRNTEPPQVVVGAGAAACSANRALPCGAKLGFCLRRRWPHPLGPVEGASEPTPCRAEREIVCGPISKSAPLPMLRTVRLHAMHLYGSSDSLDATAGSRSSASGSPASRCDLVEVVLYTFCASLRYELIADTAAPHLFEAHVQRFEARAFSASRSSFAVSTVWRTSRSA